MQPERAPAAKCRTCGYASPALNGSGITYLLSDSKLQGLEAFLLRALDECRCEVDGTPLGVSPSVSYTGHDPVVLYFAVGSRAAPYRKDFVPALRQTTAQLQPGLEPREFPSHSKLRDGIINHLMGRLEAAEQLFKAMMSDHEWDYVSQNVDTLDSRLYAMAHLACTVPQIKFVAHRTDGTEVSREEIQKRFGENQGLSWVALVVRWAPGSPEARSFEDELKRHIAAETMLAGAFEEASRALEGMLEGELDARSAYVVHAILASLYAAAHRENPHAADWAETFFAAEMARRTGPVNQVEHLDALLISDERARETIPHKAAWDAAARRLKGRQERTRSSKELKLTPEDQHWEEELRAVCAKAGHPILLQELSREFQVGGISELDVKKLIAELRFAAKALDFEWAFSAAGALTDHLVEQRRADELEEVAAALLEESGGGREAEARIDAWLGARLKLMRKPQRFLERIGAKPRPWETELAPMTKAGLWTERSNVLRLVGRHAEALEVIEDVIRAFPPDGRDEYLRVAIRNRAILLRETGALDEAYRQLQEILPRTQGRERLETLDSLALAQVETGEYAAALATYDEGVQLAAGPYADAAPRMKTGRATALSLLSRDADAAAELTALGSALGPMETLRAGSGWANVLASDIEIDEASLDVATAVVQRLWDLHNSAKESGDALISLGALRLVALIMQVLGDDIAADIWAEAYDLAKEYGAAHTPMELVNVALAAVSAGERDLFRALMAELPEVLAGAVGATSDIEAASRNVAPRLRDYSRALAAKVIQSGAPMEDVRLTAELQRDMAGRAQLVRNGAMTMDIADRLRDESLAEGGLGPLPVAVVEWMDTGSRMGALVTTISPGRDVASDFLDLPPIDLGDFTVAVRSKLDAWGPSRKGQPFDLPGWKELEAWFTGQIGPRLPEDGHLVVIEAANHWGFPWHVLARRWSCSYAASWSALLAAREAGANGAPRVLGLVKVPKSFEPERLVKFMRDSAERTRRFVRAAGWEFSEEPDETRNDQEALTRIFEASSVAKLICHGYVGQAEHDVAFMLAHDGQLPLLSGAAETGIGRAHRFGWRDCAKLARAPRVVFSAACGTGTTHAFGMGERLGVFPGLMRAGTRAFVGPKWNFYPELTLPVLDDALEAYLSGGQLLAACVHQACRRAEERLPLWLAWNLALEGDWNA